MLAYSRLKRQPFGCLFNLMQNMITFGASDLIDFLISSMLEQAILVFEKV